jgi:hypothetical protein
VTVLAVDLVLRRPVDLALLQEGDLAPRRRIPKCNTTIFSGRQHPLAVAVEAGGHDRTVAGNGVAGHVTGQKLHPVRLVDFGEGDQFATGQYVPDPHDLIAINR